MTHKAQTFATFSDLERCRIEDLWYMTDDVEEDRKQGIAIATFEDDSRIILPRDSSISPEILAPGEKSAHWKI